MSRVTRTRIRWSRRLNVTSLRQERALGNGFFGGPRQVSLRLTPSKPSLRHTALPSAKANRPFDGLADLAAKEGAQASAYHNAELRKLPPLTEPILRVGIGRAGCRIPSGKRCRNVNPNRRHLLNRPLSPHVGPVIEQAAETLQPRRTPSV